LDPAGSFTALPKTSYLDSGATSRKEGRKERKERKGEGKKGVKRERSGNAWGPSHRLMPQKLSTMDTPLVPFKTTI